MSLKVIGAGFGRTGTLSLKAALEILGYRKCYHMLEIAADPRKAAPWSEAAAGKLVDWDKVFDGYQATVDWPAARFYKELIHCYPQAKVILTVRDTDAWYDSVCKTIYPIAHSIPRWLTWISPAMRRAMRMTQDVIWQGTFKGRFLDATFAKAVYELHNTEVKATVQPRRLLVHEARDGWEPLCAFLGVPVPAVPYPHVNNAEELKNTVAKVIRIRKRALIGASALGIVALVIGAIVAVS